uniref:NADH-ubiquinone oxidoreductase chain 4L n=1 Tax=Lordithon arcuatus TaxID=2992776 RepID=A0A9E8ADM8_9COLE|nr:NADH dehydrogenase subunit 4L [Lordithon arcuatus]UZA61075.1 NADH dehydrogenase subunit 4L [Lordithon arcuatus]
MAMYFILFTYMFFMGLMSFCLKRKHFLLMLMSLEFVVISLFMNLFYFLSFFNYEQYFVMIFLTMSVCEGALGLSILVSMIRTHGNDYFQTFSILW